MNSVKLWKQRSNERLKEILRYGRYMFNDHFVLVLIFAFGAAAFYYQDWVEALDSSFPTALIFGVAFGVLLTSGTVITFFKEPDKVFLLPIETKLQAYLRRSFLLTYIWKAYWVFMVLLVAAPIYVNTTGTGREFLLFAVVALVMRGINLWIRWNCEFDADRQTIIWDTFIRFLLNGVIVFLFIKESYLLFGLCFVILIIYGSYYQVRAKNNGLPWERLIENEEKRMAFFYQLANLFTDVPHLRNRVKRRKWLDPFLGRQSVTHYQTYTYLYSRTFFRSGDYFGLFMRLTIIGSFVVWGVAGSYIGYAVAVLFLYLTGFQLLSLWKHHEAIIWTDLYPVAKVERKKAFMKILVNLLWVQNILFTVLFMTSMDWVRGFGLFALLTAFLYCFVYIFCQSRIHKWEEQYR
ncbi:ABC transporter permease [Pallidibacillus thermolactis]|jgi:ABC-2 type transport system permease protein|uniref:ABC transporter permease n=1 Tax=Pallidibacillus thermolactis TaxID=251051 RepID=UPI00156BC0EB|nr:ABC transporter permease [Pallidibacillus thermolactis]MCU9601816.1 ABC transporter permease [Pallidibacillus thermolactis subsp. kokeshiiformis]MED1674072.1 ABC transporter permease [Pallidibacillus thermolactis subsp. kokeshiiformis]